MYIHTMEEPAAVLKKIDLYVETQRELKIIRINEKICCKHIHSMAAFMYTFKYYVLDTDAHKCGKGLKYGQKGYTPT